MRLFSPIPGQQVALVSGRIPSSVCLYTTWRTELSLSSCLWNVVHNFGLVGKGVVTDVTDLPVPEGRVSSVKYFVSALRASASRDAESDCVVLVISSVN